MTTSLRSIDVRTGARLHFGLLDTVAPFGGIGLMIDRPATHLQLQFSDAFSVVATPATSADDLAGLQRRVTDVAQRFMQWMKMASLPGLQITIAQRPLAHSGLGTGTQLAMAVAAGLNQWYGAELAPQTIIRHIAARGARSGVGSYGFFYGGLVVDADPPRSLPVPSYWRIVLLRPRQEPATVSGSDESRRFAALMRATPDQHARLQALLTDQLEPFALSGDFANFAAAVRQYNWSSGKLFEASQGGPYNGPEITRLIDQVSGLGYRGVGQSSWGPTVFALCETQQDAQRLVAHRPTASASAVIATPMNRGAEVASASSV